MWAKDCSIGKWRCVGPVQDCCACLICSQVRYPHHGAMENGQDVPELLQDKKAALNPNKAEIPTPNKKKSDYPMVVSFFT